MVISSPDSTHSCNHTIYPHNYAIWWKCQCSGELVRRSEHFSAAKQRFSPKLVKHAQLGHCNSARSERALTDVQYKLVHWHWHRLCIIIALLVWTWEKWDLLCHLSYESGDTGAHGRTMASSDSNPGHRQLLRFIFPFKITCLTVRSTLRGNTTAVTNTN